MLKWIIGSIFSSSIFLCHWASALPNIDNPQVSTVGKNNIFNLTSTLQPESTICPSEFKVFFEGLQPKTPRTDQDIQGELALRPLFQRMALRYQHQKSVRPDCEYKLVEYQCNRASSRFCHVSVKVKNPWIYDSLLLRFYDGTSRLHAFFYYVQNNTNKLAAFEVEVPMDQNQQATLYAFPKTNVRVPIGKIKETMISVREE